MHQFDHRWATFVDQENTRDVTDQEKADPDFSINPRYWVSETDVTERLRRNNWTSRWLLGWRGVTAATNSRTFLATVMPVAATQHNLLLFRSNLTADYHAALLANINSLLIDFVARSKMGSYMSQFVVKQLPVLTPSQYTGSSLAFVIPRVLELTYTAHDLAPWAQDLGYSGEPFAFDPDRRAILRAELDACYAKLYGLCRDELRYILDPSDVMGKDYPSETFRVLKNKEEREFGEYRTQRLVLEAWDKLERGDLA
jgi:hypothetical protein